ncbi:MAG: MotA/TolQ/ExbB proton channel family protein [Fibromonadales bacterium]|nr:MotA/TolQ/ExbB proton channel family protein [Fibromonadales bacterium]
MIKVICCIFFMLSATVMANQQQLETLRREVEALKNIRLQKADQLEQLESQRWKERYEQDRLTQDHQDEGRALEARYSKAASDLSRISDEVGQARNLAADLEEKSKISDSGLSNFNTQVKQAVDKIAGDLATDFPVGMEQRTLSLARAGTMLERDNSQIGEAMRSLFGDQYKRLQLTQNQSFETRESQINRRTDVSVYRLRLGTVFLAEQERAEPGQSQALLRTGVLQGQVFEWRADLAASLDEGIRKAILAARETGNSLWIPLDLLQTKAIKSTTASVQEQGWQAKLKEWFKAGGIVMYPLLFVAILGLIMSIERSLAYLWRGRISRKFIDSLHTLISEKKFAKASELCSKQKTGLGNVLYAVVNQAHNSLAAAEKSLHEALLREQPALERRMGLLAAMGSIAPLLGLLGTVTGMITLFNVIIEVGTNDVKVLAGGISEALITTEAGLIIAIPILLIHGKLSENLDYITGEFGIQSFALLNRIWPEKSESNA